MLRGLKQTLCTTRTQGPTETETVPCLSLSCGRSGQQWTAAGAGIWVQQTWVWHKPSWRRSPVTSPLHRTGKLTLGGHQQNLVHQDPGERTSDPTRHWPRPACECPEIPIGGMGWQWPSAGLGALNVAVRAWGLLKEVPIIFITSTIVWPQINSRKGAQLQPSTENWIKDLLSTACPSEQDSDSPCQSLPSGSFHKPLILLHQRADRLKTTITENWPI